MSGGHAGSPATGWQQLKGPGCRSRASYGCRRHPGCTPAEPQLSSTWLLLAPPPCSSTKPTPQGFMSEAMQRPYLQDDSRFEGLRSGLPAKALPGAPCTGSCQPQDQCSGCFTGAWPPAFKCPQAGAGQGGILEGWVTGFLPAFDAQQLLAAAAMLAGGCWLLAAARHGWVGTH